MPCDFSTANGSTVTRTLIITSREDMAALNTLYKQTEGFGERTIPAKSK